ncbi:MAG: hypothetical protein K8T10_12155 [Candidatus Eremiobacteraeota bacterium]|nr:hypothetical protein [Candidatus Eremiobacteraeota bacterium]
MSKSFEELAFKPLWQVAGMLEKREISPVEVTGMTLERISKINSVIGAYYTVFEKDAMNSARQAEKEILAGDYRGPMHGIPFGVKDIFESGPTTAGSRILKDYIANEDCTVVKKLKDAGGVLLGKLANYEFAAGIPTLSSYFKPTRNPWNLEYDTGGSSSGPAASVAGGLAYGSIGSDTGGSIRFPAFCCGVTGLKPTYGTVSRHGVFPLSWNLDHVGTLARNVRDCSILLQASSGYDPLDPTSSKHPVPDYCAKLGQDIKGKRIGVPRNLFQENCGEESLSSFNKAVSRMEDLGAVVSEVETVTFSQMWAIFWLIMAVDSSSYHIKNLRKRPEDFAPDLRFLLAQGLMVSGPAYNTIQRARRVIREKVLSLFKKVDLLMVPVSGITATPIMKEPPTNYNPGENYPIYSPLFNLSGTPALALPCGFSKKGLPLGFQITGKPFDEATVLQAGHAYEQSTKWHEMHPVLGG